MEALSSGLSLIVAGEGAAREHVESSKAGLILDEVNPDQLADAIVRFSKLDRYKLSENARKYAAQLSWESCFDRQLDIYQRAIEANKRMVH